MYKPKPNEEIFAVKPIGIKYICETCKKGEMKVSFEEGKDPYVWNDRLGRQMVQHRCTSCRLEMLLPKEYPYIEWVPVADGLELAIVNPDDKFINQDGFRRFLNKLKDDLLKVREVPIEDDCFMKKLKEVFDDVPELPKVYIKVIEDYLSEPKEGDDV